MDNLCRQKDDFFDNKWYWEVTLNNGEVIYQDDYRPGCLDQEHKWLTLKQYCYTNNLFITDYWLKYRDHHKVIFTHKEPVDGAFFAFGIGKDFFFDMEAINMAIAGMVVSETIYTVCYLVPALELIEIHTRPITAEIEHFIIWNNNYARKSQRQKQFSI